MNKSALMERAVHLALKGSFTTRENPNVGCLIYKNGMVISEGCLLYTSDAADD